MASNPSWMMYSGIVYLYIYIYTHIRYSSEAFYTRKTRVTRPYQDVTPSDSSVEGSASERKVRTSPLGGA